MEKVDTIKRHDIVVMLKKNTYIHKYKEPFIAKNLDDIMELMKRVIKKRGTAKHKKSYGCFVEDGGGKMIMPEDTEKYYKFTGAICVTERELYAYSLDEGVLAPAMVDMLGAFWWAIKNDSPVITDDIGLTINNK